MAPSGRDSYLKVAYGLILEETTEPAFKMLEGLLFMKCEESPLHLWKFLSRNQGTSFQGCGRCKRLGQMILERCFLFVCFDIVGCLLSY